MWHPARRLAPLALSALLACTGDEPTAAPPPAPGPEDLEEIVKDCGPTGGGPFWVEEGRPLRVAVTCRTGAAMAPQEFRMPSLPPGARFDPETATLRWRPRLDQAGVYRLAVVIPGTGERGFVKIGVADRFDRPDNVPLADPATYTEEMGLPVMHLFLDPGVNPYAYRPARLVYGGRTWRLEAKHRGRTSLVYPKRSFTLKFPKADRFGDPLRAGGFLLKRRIALRTTFDDVSHLRERLAYEVWNRVDTAGLRVQTYSAVLYVDGAYQGLYTVSDAIHEELFVRHGAAPGGSLFKSLEHDANFFDENDTEAKFERKNEEGAVEELLEFVGFVVNADDARFEAEIAGRVDLPNYTAWLVAVSAMQAADSFAKNAYHYHDPALGLWRVIPWDFNASWGQNWDTRREPPTQHPIDHAREVNNLFRRLLDHELFGQRMREQYREALRNRIGREAVLGMVEALVAEVAPATERDARRWRSAHRSFERWADRDDFADFEQEVAYVRRWIQERWTQLEQTLLAP